MMKLIDVCKKHQDNLDEHIQSIQDKLYELAKPYEKQINHISKLNMTKLKNAVGINVLL